MVSRSGGRGGSEPALVAVPAGGARPDPDAGTPVGSSITPYGIEDFAVASGPGTVPRWRRGWVQFRYEPNALSLLRATRCILTLALVIPLFAAASLLFRPHLRSLPALAACLVVLAGIGVWNTRELAAQREHRWEWFHPVRSVTATVAVIVDYGLLGMAVGVHGGAFLLMPCVAFLVAVLLGTAGMISVAFLALVSTLGVEAGTQLPAVEAVWFTILFAGVAGIVALTFHAALQGSLYGIELNQSLAVLASHSGTLRRWPDDLGPIADRLASALDVDRYAVFTRRRGPFESVLSWPRPDWFGTGAPAPLLAAAADGGCTMTDGRLVATPATAEDVEVVLAVPATSVLGVPVDPTLLHAGVSLLAAMCSRAQLINGLVELANTDELTGIANRRHLTHVLEDEVVRSRRSGRAFAVAILDLDHFKDYNDRHGHAAGDEVLQRFCAAVGRRIRGQDVLARMGGEEFCLVLPETDATGAARLVDAVRRAVAADAPVDGITFSAGVAAWDGAESVDGLLARADAQLYVAKSTGRNRVVTAA